MLKSNAIKRVAGPINNEKMKRFILTGTPGSGKTTLIHQLANLGYEVVEEAATDIIAAEQAAGNTTPWTQANFLEKIASLQIQRQQQTHKAQSAYQFFDRSPFCTLALAHYLKFQPPQILIDEIARIKKEHIYERQVFFVENLGHCEPTQARKISFQEALRFEKIHKAVYGDHGVELVGIPHQAINERIKIILSSITK